jgi:hypothetical protein
VVSLDRNERIRLMGKFRALARGSWVKKAKGQHRGVVTHTAEAVFEALIYLVGKRPFTASLSKSSCYARPDHTTGSCMGGVRGARGI